MSNYTKPCCLVEQKQLQIWALLQRPLLADMTVSTSAPTSAGKKSKDEDPRDVYALSLRTLKEMATGSTATAEIEALSIDMDSFFQNTLPGCLALMDDFPSSADRVCSLVEAVVKRNGESFRVDMLAALASENSSSSSKLQVSF